MAASSSSSVCLVSAGLAHHNITDLPDSVKPVWTALACIIGIAAPFTTVLNCLIIRSILGDIQLRTKGYYFLLSALATSDLLVGLIVQPLICWQFVCVAAVCETPCISTVAALFGLISTVLTLCTLMMLSVERYLAIQLPIFHRVNVTRKRVAITAVGMWITVPSVTLALRIILDNYETFKTIPAMRLVLGNVAITLYCTARVYIAAYFKKKAKSNPLASSFQNQQVDEEQKRQIEDYKRAFTMGFLVLTSTLFYIPFIVVNIIKTAKGNEVSQEFKYIAPAIANTFVLLQSLVNPLLIALRITKIREKLKTYIICSLNGN